MGKGDKRSKRGKIILGTYGVRRPRKRKKAAAKAQAIASEVKA
jgi:30S ribosomal protein S31